MLQTALGPGIAAWLNDAAVVEVMLNPDGRLWVDRLGSGLPDTGERLSAGDSERIVRLVAHHVGVEVHAASPRVSAELPGTGERFEGLLPPVVAGPCFAIRKLAVAVFTLADYVAAGIMPASAAEALARAVADRDNILVAGGTSTGKTTLTNALLAEVAKTSDRVVLIEDTRELQCLTPNLVALRKGRRGLVVGPRPLLAPASPRPHPDWRGARRRGAGSSDMGRPILSAQQQGQAVPLVLVAVSPGVPPSAPPQVDLAIQQARQEREAARTSRLFLGQASTGNSAAEQRAVIPSEGSPLIVPGEPAPAASASGRGESFLARDTDRRTVSSDRVRAPASPYVVQAGSTIPAALVTGLRSDLPGQVLAQVTEPVYDSPTGRHLLIPQGSRLIGQYDAEVGYGQERVLLVWNRLILLDGRSLVLERQPGADAAGYAGLQDRVDNHWGRLFRAGLISTFLGVGAELGNEGDSDIARAIRDGAQESIGDARQEVVRRQLEVRPTLAVRPGHLVRVIVTRDLVLEPYGDNH